MVVSIGHSALIARNRISAYLAKLPFTYASGARVSCR